MLIVLRVGDGFDELRIAGVSSDILRRTGALAADHAGIRHSRLRLADLLEYDVVLPTVAEIVLVDEAILEPNEQVLNESPSFTDDRRAKLAVRRAVVRAPVNELVEVTAAARSRGGYGEE